MHRDDVEGLKPACFMWEFMLLFIAHLTGNEYQISIVLRNTTEGTGALLIFWGVRRFVLS